ncbi:MAG: O-succinylhomoserine sulfhydrylase [Pseudomonadales bacterium]
MNVFDEDDYPLRDAAFETLAIRAGHPHTGEAEHSEPIFTTSSYVFSSAAEAAARFSGKAEGNVYSRYTNPTVRNFEQRIAAMEGAQEAVATASGMAAILATMMALLSQGDHIICSNAVFGSTTVLFNKYLKKFGVDVDFVQATNMDAWQKAISPRTRMLFLETPSNPLNEIADIGKLSTLARINNALFVVDNTFCTPALQQPLSLGADIVIHSATKFIDGQGRSLGGVVLGSQELMEPLLGFVRSGGPSMSPFNAWVFLKGLETLRVRMDAHCRNAQALAEWLAQHPGVAKTHYAGLTDHPNHALAAAQQTGFGGVLSFELVCDEGDEQASAWRFIDNTRMLSHTANLGDVKSTIVHPATTTHGRLTDEERKSAGISSQLVRVAVGLENLVDIQTDLDRGFAAV